MEHLIVVKDQLHDGLTKQAVVSKEKVQTRKSVGIRLGKTIQSYGQHKLKMVAQAENIHLERFLT